MYYKLATVHSAHFPITIDIYHYNEVVREGAGERDQGHGGREWAMGEGWQEGEGCVASL